MGFISCYLKGIYSGYWTKKLVSRHKESYFIDASLMLVWYGMKPFGDTKILSS